MSTIRPGRFAQPVFVQTTPAARDPISAAIASLAVSSLGVSAGVGAVIGAVGAAAVGITASVSISYREEQ